MKLGKVLIFTVGLFFCGLAMVANVFSSSSNDGITPNLLDDLVKKIQDISQNSNCNPNDFWNKFDELRKRHMPDNRYGLSDYEGYIEKISYLNEYEVKDGIESHTITRMKNAPSCFSGTEIPYALHFNRHFFSVESGLEVSNVHVIFWSDKGSNSVCVIFWDKYKSGEPECECFDCNSMDNMRSWVEEKSQVYLSIPGSEIVKFTPIQAWEAKKAFNAQGVDPEVTCHLCNLLKNTGLPVYVLARYPEVAGILQRIVPILSRLKFVPVP